MEAFTKLLLETVPTIKEIWLIGSRAGGQPRANSDWDYLVFGDQSVLNLLTITPKLKQQNIDLLIVYDGDKFKSPWPEDGRYKQGSLLEWRWRKLGGREARYKGTRSSDGSINPETRAVLVWPECT